MSRYDGDFRPADGEPLDFAELLELLDRNSPVGDHSVGHARACYLSSSDGWREAVRQLGGAFAEGIEPNPSGQEE